MMFAALNHCYDRLAEEPDPDTGKPKLPAFGYSDEKIGYVLVISHDGDLVDVVPHFESVGKKNRPRQMPVPRPEKRTSGVQPNFLWDKSAYVLGVQPNPDKKTNSETPWLRSEKTFEAFKQHHIALFNESDDEGLLALLKFLQWWNPEYIDQPPCNHDMLHSNLVFQLDGERGYLHEREAAKTHWAEQLDTADNTAVSECLVTGKQGKIARLHPSIKGIYGGQSSGGSIVSFNAESFESYGRVQGENAPVSELAAFKYTTALNYLLNRDNRHCFSVGDASTVFWAVAEDHNQSQQAETLFAQIMNPSDEGEAAQLRPLVERISQGQPLSEVAPNIDPNTRFYLLGLTPNAARISIRFWLDSSFGELAERVAAHYTDLALDPIPWQQPPSIWRLLVELAPHRSGQKAKSEDIPTHLAGELMRAVLTGERYPYSLLAQLVLRIRSDGHISPLRVAMIKAVLHRDYRKQWIMEEIPMSLDENSESEAYQLGRLFAVLERIQSSAIKNANATITDRYFASASTVPYSVFPRLLSGAKNHLSKIRKSMPGYAVNLDKDLAGIITKLSHCFPKHLSIEHQGHFTIGYYQQRDKYFTASKESQQASDDTE
ncbi:MAG: type I-C CRISPR-associated protein Cas8c/Csd1 [Candidatus Thiodiazotropha sp. (ex Epidulcina cf. delphinae)]|nr:type I-C CRISPR-associated protein Cas8c/Csd1 [Candidatus Thiodiazotropha sp. (ex Epidulcina cf. delphinae)]